MHLAGAWVNFTQGSVVEEQLIKPLCCPAVFLFSHGFVAVLLGELGCMSIQWLGVLGSVSGPKRNCTLAHDRESCVCHRLALCCESAVLKTSSYASAEICWKSIKSIPGNWLVFFTPITRTRWKHHHKGGKYLCTKFNPKIRWSGKIRIE